jgi:hypothetical protein
MEKAEKEAIKKQLQTKEGYKGIRIELNNGEYEPTEFTGAYWKGFYKRGQWRKYAVSRGQRQYDYVPVKYKSLSAAVNFALEKIEANERAKQTFERMYEGNKKLYEKNKQ